MTATARLLRDVAGVLPDRPFALDLWDGTSLPPTTPGGPRFTARSPAALAHLLRAPGQLGLARAYATGALEVDDLDAVIRVVVGWQPPPIAPADRARLLLSAARATGPVLPRRPSMEVRLRGPRHSKRRDAQAVRHHYDVGNDFFALFLDASMTYSCAIFSRGATTLEEAQRTKLDLICSKLGLKARERLLDVGCGWGALAIHAAREYGAQVTGITLSPPQAERARVRAQEAGVGDRVRIEVADYRDLAGEPFDAIASIGMVEHVGEERIDEYAARLAGLLTPGGRLLNHGIARLRHTDAPSGPFNDRYVFPDGLPLHLSRVVLALERAGLETHHVEDFREDYVTTLRHWAARLDERLEEAERIAGAERLRVWRLYLRGAASSFERGVTSIFQVRASRP